MKTTDVMKLWNKYCTRLPRVISLSDKRRTHIKARFEDYKTEEQWVEIFHKLNASDFCCGLNQRGWTAKFDWILKANNIEKVLEGNYDNIAAKANVMKNLHLLKRGDNDGRRQIFNSTGRELQRNNELPEKRHLLGDVREKLK